jgi:hypothetical protein
MALRYLPFFLCFLFLISANSKSMAGPDKHSIAFIENNGQVTDQNGNSRPDIDFKLSAAPGLNLFIGKGGLHYQWAKATAPAAYRLLTDRRKNAPPNPLEMYRMDVVLIGANPNAVITREGPLTFHENYLCSATGMVAHAYSKITYHNIYPHIDWVLYLNADGHLEHDFVIRPGGNVSDIRLQYDGASTISSANNGGLISVTPLGKLTESAPYAYVQQTHMHIPASFVLHDNFLSFSTAAYKGTLIIDPIVDWGTYIGGTDADMIYDNVIGKDGNIYTTGATSSISNIATTGAYQYNYAGGTAYLNDAFISKFSPDGTCIWSTYYGTSAEDAAKSISADTNGNIYIAGYTASTTGLSSTAAQQATGHGGYDGFVAKFDTSGQRIWGTYFGGEGDDGGYGPIALHCDRYNNIYLTGQTNSATGITTIGAYQPSLYAGVGDQDAFLAKYNSNGVLQWSTYVGGNFGDAAYAVTNDSEGNIYITGNTNSTTGIASVGQTSNAGGYDGFVAKFDASGNKLWGTYVGGNQDEYVLGITADNAANIYLCGLTTSTSGLASSGAHQMVYGGGYQDAMLAKLNSGGLLQWATYYGGSSEDQGDKVIIGANGDIYMSGFTGSDTGIVTGSAFQPALGGAYDGLVARFNSGGNTIWGSYLGGADADEAFCIVADSTFNLYIGGNTMSANGIATSGSWQSLYGGGDYDAFLLRVKDCAAPAMPDSISGMAVICAGSSHTYAALSTNASSYNWILPNGWTGNSSTDSITVTSNGNSGVLRVVAVNDCSSSDTVSLSLTVNILPVTPQIIQSGNVLSVSGVYTSYQWNKDGQAIAGANGATYSITANGSYSVTVSNAAGCSVTSDPLNLNVTAIHELLSQNGITVYPNPATTAVYINTPIPALARLMNIQGQLLDTKGMATGVNSLKLDSYASGIYFLHLTDKNGADLGMQKIIKE